MAEPEWTDLDTIEPEKGPSDATPTWGDYGNVASAAVKETGSALAGGVRRASDGEEKPESKFINAFAKHLQKALGDSADTDIKDTSEATQQRLNAAITDPAFYKHPFSAAILQSVRMTPFVGATVLGGLVAGPIGAAVVAGELNKDFVVNDIYKGLDKPDDELQKENQPYAALRSMGMSEDDARAKLKEQAFGLKPLINAAVGAAVGLVGPGGQAVRAITGRAVAGAAERGALGRATVAGGEAGATGAAQAGVATGSVQQAEVDTGARQELDPAAIAAAAATGGVLSAVPGAATGAIPRGRATAPVDTRKGPVEVVDPASPDSAQTLALDANKSEPAQPERAPPAEPAPAPQPGPQPGPQEATPAAPAPAPPPVARPEQGPATEAPPDIPKRDKRADVEKLVKETGNTSLSYAQRKLKIPYDELLPIFDQLQKDGVVTAKDTRGRRKYIEPEVPKDVAEASEKVKEAQPAEKPTAKPETVTPEVTPAASEDTPAPAEVAKASDDVAAEQSGPKVLRATDDAEKKAVADAKAKQAEIDAAKPAEKKEPAGDKNAQRVAKRAADGEAAKKIFDDTDVIRTLPRNVAERSALRERLGNILEQAKAAGIDKVPKRVGGEKMPDHLVWLREVQQLHDAMSKKDFGAKTSHTEHMTDFITRETLAKAGDFEQMRAERKAAGEQNKRQHGGTDRVEQVAATHEVTTDEREGQPKVEGELAPHEDDVSPGEKAVPSRKGANVDDGTEEGPLGPRAKAASAVKKVQISAEEKARIEAEINRTATKAPKLEEVKKRVAARKAPTEAQKEAGNYAKGHERVHGLDVSIENPKGSTRSGTGRDGKPWSVKMPADYGYIKRTEGADGDHVDVMLGPKRESPHVFVVDQQHLDNRSVTKFDEHKVLMGFEKPEQALHAYDKSFSDGRGLERIQKVTPMSVEQFKEWLKEGDTKKEIQPQVEPEVTPEVTAKPAKAMDAADAWLAANDPDHIPAAVRAEPTDDQIRQVMRQMGEAQGTHTVRIGNTRVATLHTGSSAEALNDIRPGVQGDVPAALFPFLRKRLIDLVGDVPMHHLSADSMRRVVEASNGSLHETTAGYHSLHGKTGDDHIVLDVAKMSSPAEAAHIVMHEVTHAATRHAMLEDERSGGKVNRAIQAIMDEARMADPLLEQDHNYAFTAPVEFVAEAQSKAGLQERLASIPLSPELATALGLPKWKATSAWSGVIGAVRKLLRLPPNYHTALEGILRVNDHLMQKNVKVRQEGFKAGMGGEAPIHAALNVMGHDIQEKIQQAIKRVPEQEQRSAPWALKVMTGDQIAQAADRFFSSDVVRRIVNLTEATRVTASKLLQKTSPMIAEMSAAKHKYAGPVWDHFANFLHDETIAGVYADRNLEGNTHLGKNRLDTTWEKAQHARLAAEYAKVPAELRAIRTKMHAYFRDEQNAMSLDLIQNKLLRALGVKDDAMGKRIFDNQTTLADVDAVGGQHIMDMILDAKELSKIDGPYIPLMRQGTHIVRGTYKITPPKNAVRQVDRNVWDFATREDAEKFVQAQDTPTELKSVWVDKTTGEKFVTDDAGKEVKITSSDTDAVQRFRASVQDEHVEMFSSAKEARRAAAEYEKPSDGTPSMFSEVKGAQERKFEPGDRQANMMSAQLQTLMRTVEKSAGYKDLSPSAKHEFTQTAGLVAMKYLGSTRMQSRRLPRRRIAGASNDIVKNSWDYAQSVSGYRAKLQHHPELEAARQEMLSAVDGDETKSNSMGRRAIANEMSRREAKNDSYAGKQNPWVNRALTLSFLDKLAGPSQNIVNSMQVAMVTAPYLAGRHGPAATFMGIRRAYSDIAGFSIVKQGLRATAKAFKGENEAPNFATDIKNNLSSPAEKRFIDRTVEVGAMDPDAGLEIGQLIQSHEKGAAATFDKGLGYVEGIFRQMPRAVETINRAATGLAAFRLELAKNGGDEAAATKYAIDAIRNTQGQFSATNRAPMFNHPVFKLTFQFKQYGQMIYHLLGQQVAKAYRNENAGDRAEAMKTLGYVAMAQMTVAGALGLPTEPFKWLLMGAKAAGLTSTGWGDVENYERELAAGAFGKTAGEIFSKGLPRAFGVDLSGRVGYDNLVGGFGEPKSDKKNDVKAWLWDTLTGAPMSLAADYVSGANDLWAGNTAQGAEKIINLKVIADSIRAYRMATEGKKSAAGRQLSTPYSWGEVGTRVMGFTPQRDAEEGAQAAAFYSKSTAEKDQRSDLMAKWVSATNASDKSKAQAAVNTFNKTAGDNKILPKDLVSAAKRRQAQGVGIVANKRSAHIKREVEAAYNP